jgi:hypothetical protein
VKVALQATITRCTRLAPQLLCPDACATEFRSTKTGYTSTVDPSPTPYYMPQLAGFSQWAKFHRKLE